MVFTDASNVETRTFHLAPFQLTGCTTAVCTMACNDYNINNGEQLAGSHKEWQLQLYLY